jgi:NTE family protein
MGEDIRIGLALGGGGAKGLAHIPLLRVFDEMQLRPHCIAGTSIGSVIGALYASGKSGERIAEGVARMIISKGDSFRDALKKRDVLRWVEFFDIEFGKSALFKGDKFIDFLYEAMGAQTFEDLEIPLQVVATDFWASSQVVFDSGPLLPAVKASMGLPGVFTPVQIDDRVLIDGGGVNPVPHDLLTDCDVVVAIDVMGSLSQRPGKVPNVLRSVLGTFDIMQNSIIAEKCKACPPDIYIRPEITDIDILDFYKADVIYEQTQPSVARLRGELERVLKART